MNKTMLGCAIFFQMFAAINLLCGIAEAPKLCTGGVFWGPMLAIALFLMLVCISMIVAARLKFSDLYVCYLVGVSIVILALLVFTIFGFVAVGGIAGSGGSRVGEEYKLEEYSGWLRDRVADRRYWETASACLRRGDVCNGMAQLMRDPDTGAFVPWLSSDQRWEQERGADVHQMSPIESGCCKPPSWCAFTYVNGTTWTPTPDAPANADCSRWGNDKETLCFQCDSCKAGFLHHTKRAWGPAVIFPIVTLVFLICACSCLFSGDD